MSTTSIGIAWTHRTWNPLRGCSRVSAGCQHCYAETLAWRFHRPGQPYEGLTRMTSHGPVWTGDVRLIEREMESPRHWRTPSKIFVNSMSDLFHEAVPDAWLAHIFAVMRDCSHHTFQILTKRPARAAAWPGPWPPNIWMGTSVENTATLHRLDTLRACPAPIRFISFEPLLDAVLSETDTSLLRDYHWVIVGGESGPQARPCAVAWIRAIVQQCQERAIPVFVKQLGASNRCPHDTKGGHPDCWPADLRLQAFPG